MKEFRQARWREELIFELSSEGRIGYEPPELDPYLVGSVGDIYQYFPRHLVRDEINLPEVSQPQVVRHFTRLSQMSFGVDEGTYPLGSCTMKYTPRVLEDIASSRRATDPHPLQPEETVQGILEILYELADYLAEIAGMDKVSLQPAAGAAGELTGTLIIRKFHEVHGELETRREIIVPDSAHGTNPASARMAGFRVVVVPSNQEGCIDIEALKSILSERTAGLMLTNPNTLGLFETEITEVTRLVHDVGALLYYDGANLNAIAGIVRPGDMGFDIAHLNLHKTFSTPHGGGGPGSGPLGVKKYLAEYLPRPTIEYDGEKYFFNYDLKHSVGRMHPFYGNISVLLKAYAYIRLMGPEGLKRASQIAVLNSNYLLSRLRRLPETNLPYSTKRPRKHEFVVNFMAGGDRDVRTLDIAKRLMDHGVHAPTVYFPLIVEDAFMVEPTESESREELDLYFEAIREVLREVREEPQKVRGAPRNTAVGRIDEARASRPTTMLPSYKWMIERSER
ncbi:MAG: aminotransferase class V-fold PLP-dependent enzyme [Nitrososphaeria archaeon]|nr:aminotransferase class V-fold PLP-dependent enzyme [Nitrososphaeria archaeon]NIQ34207.1 aminotransferase class V-fold PLP-dependent enzyme [Nitrososphaeria archaeon]